MVAYQHFALTIHLLMKSEGQVVSCNTPKSHAATFSYCSYSSKSGGERKNHYTYVVHRISRQLASEHSIRRDPEMQGSD